MTRPNADDAQLQTLAAAVVAYLEVHPNASDTLEGIHRWWLTSDLPHSTADVARVLEQLCAQGKIEVCPTPDGKSVFRRSHAV